VSGSQSQSLAPIPCMWDADSRAFRPLPAFARRTADVYGHSEVVTLAPVEDRSAASHRHYFAAINECWRSLPEELTLQFSSPDHLRKAALIKAGYRDERSIVCSSHAEALRVAAFIRPLDDYAIVSVVGSTVVQLTAKSQSQKAMGKEVFGESKEAVFNVLADMLGVPVGDLPTSEAA
jgi:hypothetical protein